MGLRTYIFKRIINSLILIYFVITLNFIIFALMPGNPLEHYVSALRIKNPLQAERLKQTWGLDRPLSERYVTYLGNMLTMNFGESYHSQQAVAIELTQRLPYTLLLMGGSLILSLGIGIILGVMAARKRGSLFDSLSVVASLTTYAMPTFWMGMIFLLVFFLNLHWFPGSGAFPQAWIGSWPKPLLSVVIPGTQLTLTIPSLVEIGGRLYHLALPLLTLTLFHYGGWLLLTRATMLETLTEDYVMTAKAKGLKERTVLFKHALKNASLPIVTSAAMSIGFLISGAIITETVFTYPGLGWWSWNAILNYDYPILQAFFYVIALCVIIANFLADLLYGVIDPRIKYG